MALALGLLKFHLVVPIGHHNAYARQGRFRAGFAAGCALTVTLSAAVFGLGILLACPVFLSHLRSLPMMGIRLWFMTNIRGLLYLLLGHAPRGLVAGVSIAVLVWAAVRWRDLGHGFALSMTAVLLTSYHLNPHDLLLLLIPLAIWIRNLK